MQCYFWFPCQIKFCFESKYSIQVSYKYWQYIIYSLNYFRLAKNIVNIKAQQLLIHILTHWNYFDEVCSKEEPLRFFLSLSFIPADVVDFIFGWTPSYDDKISVQGDAYLYMNDSSIHLYVYCVVNLLISKDQWPLLKLEKASTFKTDFVIEI